MPFAERIKLFKEIEDLRSSKLLVYVTSTRPGATGNIADDAVRVFCEHLRKLPSRHIDRLDLMLVSNGGTSTVPWRLVALIREYAREFNVLMPSRAYSAASILALGANSILMHPFAEMGPIDPTVANDFNPKDPVTGRVLGISVEDVTAYISFIKDTVGITHEDELIEAVKVLVRSVHPLAIGNVERFISQSRLTAKKILGTHMERQQDAHKISEIVENMASKLYFHGHPINRVEAKEELGLKVDMEASAQIEEPLWRLFCDYEEEYHMNEEFNPVHDLNSLRRKGPSTEAQKKRDDRRNELNAKIAAAIIAMQIAQQAGDAVKAAQHQLLANQLQADLQRAEMEGDSVEKEYEVVYASIESMPLSSVYVSNKVISLRPGANPTEVLFKEDVLSQGWRHFQA